MNSRISCTVTSYTSSSKRCLVRKVVDSERDRYIYIKEIDYFDRYSPG